MSGGRLDPEGVAGFRTRRRGRHPEGDFNSRPFDAPLWNAGYCGKWCPTAVEVQDSFTFHKSLNKCNK